MVLTVLLCMDCESPAGLCICGDSGCARGCHWVRFGSRRQILSWGIVISGPVTSGGGGNAALVVKFLTGLVLFPCCCWFN